MKIGWFGGTFNPVHMGHLVLAQECWYRLGLDKVVFVPAYLPPHKEVGGEVSAADRLNMLRIALEGDERFEISTYEIDKGGTSYSIDTIKHFLEEYGGDVELFFLAGSDMAEGLSTWKDVEDILRLTTFVIATRPGGVESGTPYEESLRRVVTPGIDISSSMIRERIQNREPIDYLVPAVVVRFIRDKGLYSS